MPVRNLISHVRYLFTVRRRCRSTVSVRSLTLSLNYLPPTLNPLTITTLSAAKSPTVFLTSVTLPVVTMSSFSFQVVKAAMVACFITSVCKSIHTHISLRLLPTSTVAGSTTPRVSASVGPLPLRNGSWNSVAKPSKNRWWLLRKIIPFTLFICPLKIGKNCTAVC